MVKDHSQHPISGPGADGSAGFPTRFPFPIVLEFSGLATANKKV